MKLTIELVPRTVWYKSLYQILPREVWNKIRNEIIKKEGYKCQICGSTHPPMQLHEIWSYDDKNHVQKLLGFQLLCRMCHHVKHIGLAGILAERGELDFDEVIRHFCKVNNCPLRTFNKHYDQAFEIWEERSGHKWKQDFGEYNKFVTLARKKE